MSGEMSGEIQISGGKFKYTGGNVLDPWLG